MRGEEHILQHTSYMSVSLQYSPNIFLIVLNISGIKTTSKGYNRDFHIKHEHLLTRLSKKQNSKDQESFFAIVQSCYEYLGVAVD